MSTLADYANKYRTIRMERRNGILQMTLHTDGGPLRWGFLPHGELPDAFYDVGARPRQPGGDHHRHRRGVFRAAGEPRHLILPDPSVDRADRPHPLGGPPPVDEAPRNRGAGDQRGQRAGLAPFRDPALVRHRARRRYRAVPGLGALPIRRGAGRRHAHRLPAAPRHEPGPLLPPDRADAQRSEGARAGPRRRGPAARQAPGARLGAGGGPRPPADSRSCVTRASC